MKMYLIESGVLLRVVSNEMLHSLWCPEFFLNMDEDHIYLGRFPNDHNVELWHT
jgi:hypothetical protein